MLTKNDTPLITYNGHAVFGHNYRVAMISKLYLIVKIIKMSTMKIDGTEMTCGKAEF